MNIGLITPLHHDVSNNPGCFFITDGMKWLLRQAEPTASFHFVDMLRHDAPGWSTLHQQCDAFMLAGNPRFNPTEEKTYWDWDIWPHIAAAIKAGVRFADGWAGGTYYVPLRETSAMVQALSRIQKNRAVLEFESQASLCIARDPIAYALLQQVNPETRLLPCSSWFAKDWNHVVPATKNRHLINVRRLPGNEWVVGRLLELQRQLAKERPTYVVTHCHQDYAWVTAICPDVPNLIVLHDPESLLQWYARTDKLLSFRLHATIPALSLGARVCDMAIDSRGLAAQQFGVDSVPYTELRRADFRPTFQAMTRPPDIRAITDVLRRFLQRS